MPRKEPRNYKQEYAEYHGKPQQRKNRSMRNKAVRKLGREGKASKDGKEVDHKRGVRRGNGDDNLQIIMRKANRRKGNR